MTKKVLLFTAISGIVGLTLSSYQDGPAKNGLNRTGSAGSSSSCSGTGCHAANINNRYDEVALWDSSTGLVYEYIPGKTYRVSIISHSDTPNLSKFGFQLSAVSGASNDIQAGTFNTSGTAGIAVRSVGSLSFVEHTSPLSAIASGTRWGYSTAFYWTAPPAGTGAVTFFLELNAVNGDGTANGDQPNSGRIRYNESPTSVHEVTNNIEVKAYPNPTSNLLHISMENAAAGKYAVEAFDMSGKKLLNETINVTGATSETTVSMQNWPAGMYHVVISKDGNKKVVPVVKQ